jgi:hypothetical protein
MARKPKKKALYEVIGRDWYKSSYGKELERIPPEETADRPPDGASTEAEMRKRAVQWPKRPKILQFQANRIDISMPYQVAIAILLGVILVVLVAFRIGEYSYRSSQKTAVKPITAGESAKSMETLTPETSPAALEEADISALAQLLGDHRIVITQYNSRRDLEPVQKYFAANGIETIIEQRDNWFFLVTSDTYENPQRSGTDGNAAKKKIIEIGAGYKAPQDYESFAPKLFSDAYGEKVK